MPRHERLEPGVDEMDYSVAGFFEEEELGGTVLGMSFLNIRASLKSFISFS